MSNKPTVVIQDYSIILDPYWNDPYTAPEAIPCVLTGKVYGHLNIKDGHNVVTSHILDFNEDTGIVETRNTKYVLGKKSENYELYCQGYESRF